MPTNSGDSLKRSRSQAEPKNFALRFHGRGRRAQFQALAARWQAGSGELERKRAPADVDEWPMEQTAKAFDIRNVVC
jgi:hypothetical protein